MDKDKSKGSNFFKDWIIPIALGIGLYFVITKFFFISVELPPSGSMIPTLNDNDRIFATRVWNKENIKRGDILVFNSEELDATLIKRVIGLPGDHIDIVNGVVSVNGEVLDEDYVKNNESYNGEFDVPDGELFFLGDNRANSLDSRYWENPYIDESEVIGKASLRYYPIKSFGFVD